MVCGFSADTRFLKCLHLHLSQTIEQFDSVMNINVKSAFLGMKHSVKAMLQKKSQGRGGSIVLCSSQLGLDG